MTIGAEIPLPHKKQHIESIASNVLPLTFIYSTNTGWFDFWKLINVIHYINHQ